MSKFLITWIGEAVTCNAQVLTCRHFFNCNEEKTADEKIIELLANRSYSDIEKYQLVEHVRWDTEYVPVGERQDIIID